VLTTRIPGVRPAGISREGRDHEAPAADRLGIESRSEVRSKVKSRFKARRKDAQQTPEELAALIAERDRAMSDAPGEQWVPTAQVGDVFSPRHARSPPG
jgi:hypothetical protein